MCVKVQADSYSNLNTLRLRKNGRRFQNIFKCIFLNENAWISIKISLKFVPKGPINNIPALVQIMAWRWPGDKPLSEPMMISLLMHICVARPQWVKLTTSETWRRSLILMRKTRSPLSSKVNTLRLRQDGRHFSRRHFQMHFREWKSMNFD